MDIITIYVGMGIRGPIAEGDYNVGDTKISISYPQQINFGFLPGPIDLPKSLSTVFTVSWQDKNVERPRDCAAIQLIGSCQSTML